MTPDFINVEGDIRKFVRNTNEENSSQWWGYLNSKEIDLMQKSGLVDFQAHGLSHTWYNSSDKIIDIYDGKNFYPHLIWNNPKNDKSNWLTNFIEPEIGTPVFEHKKSLELESVYKVDRLHIKKLIKLYNPKLNKKDNINLFKTYVEKNKEIGQYETPVESAVGRKNLEVQKIFCQNYRCSVNYLVFPGGGKSKKQ